VHCCFCFSGALNNDFVPYRNNQQDILTWLNNSASSSYRTFIKNSSCPFNEQSSIYNFCAQDTILTQSPVLASLTVKSATDYQMAVQYSRKNYPKIYLTTPTSYDTPYTYLFSIPHDQIYNNNTLTSVAVTLNSDFIGSVFLRENNVSELRNCTSTGDNNYNCYFKYNIDTRSQLQPS